VKNGYVIAALVGDFFAFLNAAANLFIMNQEGAAVGSREVVAFAVPFVAFPLLTVGAYALFRAVRRSGASTGSR
jgi:hypothetical protein